jgi:NAD(P)-dependent dehydrogenase (short-subunit alcohol dehydrogenase family)
MRDPRTILITGCSSGIGLCTARGLRERGHRVFATARRRADVARLAAEGFESLLLDYDDSDTIQACVSEVLDRTGGDLYALFNNGAYGQPGAVEDLSREVLRAQFETNLFGWHELTRAVIPAMRTAGRGRIIQNSSVLGFAAMAFRGAYNASKFALEGLSDTLRLELRGSGIEVILIEPGPVESRFRANSYIKFRETIDRDHSVFATTYAAMEARLTREGPTTTFTLPPEAVLKKVIHALESRRPRPRYYVTLPTHAFGLLKRVLGTRTMDALLARAGGGGRR